MCVYCKEAPACDHERDACTASRGEYCAKCGHRSAAFLSRPPGPRWAFSWFLTGKSPQAKAVVEEGTSGARGKRAAPKKKPP